MSFGAIIDVITVTLTKAPSIAVMAGGAIPFIGLMNAYRYASNDNFGKVYRDSLLVGYIGANAIAAGFLVATFPQPTRAFWTVVFLGPIIAYIIGTIVAAIVVEMGYSGIEAATS